MPNKQGQRVEDSHTEPKKQEIPTKKDPFLTNTKMNQDEKKLFLDYIRAVGDEARKNMVIIAIKSITLLLTPSRVFPTQKINYNP